MIPIIIAIILLVSALIYDFKGNGTGLLSAITFNILLFTVLAICNIESSAINSTTSFEPIISVNHMYVNTDGSIITVRNTRKTIDNFIVIHDTDLNENVVPWLKLITEIHSSSILWTFNHSTTYQYSIVLLPKGDYKGDK
jgi:hypothetical protein